LTTSEQLIVETNTRLKGVVLKTAAEIAAIRRVQSGLFSFDAHTGGGLPMGVPISIQGTKSVGKSAFCYYLCGKAEQQYGGSGLLVQTEGGFVPQWAQRCGLPQCDYVPAIMADTEQHTLGDTLELILNILRKSQPTWILLDSLSMLAADPKKAIMDSTSRGERAIPNNKFFRNLMAAMNNEWPPLFLYIEHLHPVMGQPGQMVTGGVTKEYANVLEVRLRLDADSSDKKQIESDLGVEELPIRQRVQWEIKKSKVSPRFGRGVYTLDLRDTDCSIGGRISDFDEMLVRAINRGHVIKSGAWYKIGDAKYQGLDNLRAAITDDALRSISEQPRQESGTEDGDGNRIKAKAGFRLRAEEGGHDEGDVPDRAQGDGKKVDKSAKRMAGKDKGRGSK